MIAIFIAFLFFLCILLIVHCNKPLFSNVNVCVVISHPDDETLFFLPTLINAIRSNNQVHLLCLSKGNVDGLGETRSKELNAAVRLLGMRADRVKIIDDKKLPDSMGAYWDKEVINKYVDKYVQDNHIQALITFDSSGISNHINHRAVHYAVKHYISNHSNLSAYELITTNIVRKYCSVLEIIFSFIEAKILNKEIHLVTHFNPLLNDGCMRAHTSQYLWYRKLFVIFSRYSFINTLRSMK
jgi:N-acetylglucosaminylphosphatidylinositol deacetylase